MSIEIKVPVFPESVSEGEIASWHVAEGDAFSEGDVLVEIETDKVVMEVPAIESGVMGKISKDEGETVTSEEVIGHFEAGAAPEQPAESAPEKAQTPATKEAPKAAANKPAKAESVDGSPAVRRLANSNDVDVKQVEGTGKKGRVTAQDMKTHIAGGGSRAEERVPMSRLRRTVAKRLLEVQETTAMLTTFNEVDMQPVMELRKKYKEAFEKEHDVRLGFMSFFTKAATEALKKFPSVNASIDGTDIVYHSYCDVGIAVSSPRGLVVPVLRNTENLSMAEMEQQIRELAVKARDGSLTIEDMQGGTFTITNGGTFGSMLSTPIINAPQSAILGMHNIVERPMVVNGEIVIRPIMYLALSYDHRIIDGQESVKFLKTIKDLLEDPARMLLNI